MCSGPGSTKCCNTKPAVKTQTRHFPSLGLIWKIRGLDCMIAKSLHSPPFWETVFWNSWRKQDRGLRALVGCNCNSEKKPTVASLELIHLLFVRFCMLVHNDLYAYKQSLHIGKDPDAGKDWRQDDRGWDGWIALPTQCTWIWANSGDWWRTGKLAAVHGVAKSLKRLRDQQQM